MTGASVLFVARTPNQIDDAERVAAHLDIARFFDARSGGLVPAAPLPSDLGPWIREAARFARAVRAERPDVVVFPQDIGLFERSAIAAARRAGARIALLPDGVITDAPLDLSGTTGGVRGRVDALLVRTRLLAGDRGRWGSSRPDLVLSAGPAWDELWQRLAPGARLAVVGSPRSDALAAVGPCPADGDVLVCSQPLWEVGVPDNGLTEWYRWMSDQSRAGHRVRLHPRELGDARVPELLRSDSSTGLLVDDLSAASAVVAPFSGVLLEAAVCGRPVASVRPAALDLSAVSSVPFLAEPAVPKLTCAEADQPAIAASAVPEEAGRYLANIGTAAESAADALLTHAA